MPIDMSHISPMPEHPIDAAPLHNSIIEKFDNLTGSFAIFKNILSILSWH